MLLCANLMGDQQSKQRRLSGRRESGEANDLTTEVTSQISQHAPQLSLGNAPSPMSSSPYSQRNVQASQTPTHITSSHNQDSFLANATANPSTPIRIASRPSSTTPLRQVSQHHDLAPSSPLPPTNADGTIESEGSPWSGAVGPATLNGKTGRVVERLQKEKDDLRRDRNAQREMREEMERREGVHLSSIDSLRTQNENLQRAADNDAMVIERSMQKIDELKALVAKEERRRIQAEEKAGRATFEKEQAIEKAAKEVQEASERAKREEVNASILRNEHSADTRRMNLLAEHQAEHERRLKINHEQQKHELENARRSMDQLRNIATDYREMAGASEAQKQQEDAAQRAQVRLAAARVKELDVKVQRTVGEARYYCNLSRIALKEEGSSGTVSPESPASPMSADAPTTPPRPPIPRRSDERIGYKRRKDSHEEGRP